MQQNNPNMKEQLVNLYQKHPKSVATMLNTPKYTQLREWVYENTPRKIQSSEYRLSTRIFWIVNDLVDFPKCSNCGKTFGIGKNIRVTKGYSKLCPYCSQHGPEALKKRDETCIRKYGSKNPLGSPEIKEKLRQNNIRKFGSPCPLQNTEVQKKTKQTIMEKYGTDHYSHTKEYKEKVRNTCLEKYGVDNVFKSTDIKEKMRLGMLEKYGVEHNSQSEELKERNRRRLIERYGDDYRQVLWGGHGNPGQSRRAYALMKKSELVEPLFTEDEYVEGKKKDVHAEFMFRCRKCGEEFMSWWDNGHSKACPKCSREHGTSKEENALVETVKSVYDGELILNDRGLVKPFEIDIVVPDRKLAFEFDGLFWHNDGIHKDRNYHLVKTEECERHGFQLVHVFEDEWRYRNRIVVSRIRNLFGVYERTIYARKCMIGMVTSAEAADFLDENHLQGAVRSGVNLGLYFKGELVSLMTFGKSRFSKKYEWEMLRFCNKMGCHVPGAASRLLKRFEELHHPKSLVSYADRRWSTGKLYRTLGFDLVSKSRPNYWYFKGSEGKLMSRMKFQKHRLAKILKDFDPGKSEVENMRNNGYFRIFDCGNLVFAKTYDWNGV